jgi:hypothetical protein
VLLAGFLGGIVAERHRQAGLELGLHQSSHRLSVRTTMSVDDMFPRAIGAAIQASPERRASQPIRKMRSCGVDTDNKFKVHRGGGGGMIRRHQNSLIVEPATVASRCCRVRLAQSVGPATRLGSQE